MSAANKSNDDRVPSANRSVSRSNQSNVKNQVEGRDRVNGSLAGNSRLEANVGNGRSGSQGKQGEQVIL